MFIADIVKTRKKNTAAPDELLFSSYGEAHRMKQDLEKLKENELKVSFKNDNQGDDNDTDDEEDDERNGDPAHHHHHRITRSERNRRSSLSLRSGSIFYSNGTSGSSLSHKERMSRIKGAISAPPEAVDLSTDPTGDDDHQGDEKNQFGALSSLDPHTVRWLNRRKTTKGPLAALYSYQTTLASALPYKPIFKGLDTADEGDIELSDIEDVIKKLSKPKPGEERLFDDPKAILNFFKQMDTDGGGTVDFGEFAIGMTNCPGGKAADGVVRLQEAFMKYSSDIQRLAILKRATNPAVSDLDRFNAMKKLFEVAIASNQDIDGVTKEDVTRNAYRRFEQTKQQVNEQTRDQRLKDFERARAAKVFFDYEKKGTLFGSSRPSTTLPFMTDEAVACLLEDGVPPPATANGSRSRNSTRGRHTRSTANLTTSSRVGSRATSRAVSRRGPVGDPVLADLRDADEVMRKVTKHLSHRLGQLPLAEKYRTDVAAAAPAVSGSFGSRSYEPQTYNNVRLQARFDARRVNYCAPALLPPPVSAIRRNTGLTPLIKSTSTMSSTS